MSGVRLTAFGGSANDLPAEVLEDVANAMHRGELSWPITVYPLDDIARAHEDMEHNRVTGKQVVVTRP